MPNDKHTDETEETMDEAGVPDALVSEQELAELANAEEVEFASVTYETPSGTEIDHGWITTGTFLNTDVPLIIVVRRSRVLKVPLDRVVSVDRLPDPRADAEHENVDVELGRRAREFGVSERDGPGGAR